MRLHMEMKNQLRKLKNKLKNGFKNICLKDIHNNNKKRKKILIDK